MLSKRDAFNGRFECGVSKGQGSGGVLCLALKAILRNYFLRERDGYEDVVELVVD